MKGKIIKLVGGIYTVKCFEDNKIHTVKPKGVFRYHQISPKVGDDVEFNESTILKLIDRKNTFVRPQISNVDYCLLVTSLKSPDLSLELLDRFLINIIRSNVEPIIIITKCDLGTKDELERVKEYMSYYSKYYKVFYSSKEGMSNRDEFDNLLKGKISVLSGQTGAGKSHLLNTIYPELGLETQEISKALGRGKHTTRETTLYEIGEKYIADTPGFSSLEFYDIEPTDLKEYFPEFVELLNKCKYNQCLHISEPGCIVKEKVATSEILKSRYDSYLKIYTELKNNKPIYRRDK